MQDRTTLRHRCLLAVREGRTVLGGQSLLHDYLRILQLTVPHDSHTTPGRIRAVHHITDRPGDRPAGQLNKRHRLRSAGRSWLWSTAYPHHSSSPPIDPTPSHRNCHGSDDIHSSHSSDGLHSKLHSCSQQPSSAVHPRVCLCCSAASRITTTLRPRLYCWLDSRRAA